MADVIGGSLQEAKDCEARIAVIGCGNLARSDDGVGIEVVRALSTRPLRNDPRVSLLDAGTDGMLVMTVARECSTLIIVDACRSGTEPGAVFEVPGAELEQPHSPSFTLHDFRWDHALSAARQMSRERAAATTVILVEAASLDFGIGLSDSVRCAAQRVVERIEEMVRSQLNKDNLLQ